MSGSPTTYRVAIVGAGQIAHAHARACAQTERAELVAVCDVSQEAAERFAEQHRVAATYTVLEEMLEREQIDIAVVSTWQVNHADVATRIATSKRVKAILCEKPFTANAAEAEQLVATCRSSGVLITEAWKFRHHPMHLKAKEIVDSAGIGDVNHINSTFCHPFENRQPGTHWYWDRSRTGGAVYIVACYNIHHARFVFGEEPEGVFATQVPGVEVDDGVSITLIYSGGRTAQITAGFSSYHTQRIEVIGSRGLLRIEDIAWNNENQAVVLKQRTSDGEAHFEFEPTYQFTLQLEHLCGVLDTGRAHRVPPEDAIAQMKVLDAVFASFGSGQVVAV